MGISLSGLSSGMDTDAIIKEMMKAHSLKVDNLTKQKSKIEMKKDVWSSVNKNILKFYNGTLNNLKMQGTFMTKKASVLNSSKGSATATISAANGTYEFDVTHLAKGSGVASSKAIMLNRTNALGSTKLSDLKNKLDDGTEITMDADTKFIKIQSTIDGQEKLIAIDPEETLNSLAKKIASADSNLIVNYEERYGRMMIRTKDTGADKQVLITALKSDITDETGKHTDTNIGSNLFELLHMNSNDGVATANQGQDALFSYNGASRLTSSSNQIEIGGIKLNVFAEGKNQVVVEGNTDEIYKAVKGFVKEYNEILKELNDRAYSGVAKGYEPLTKEEKSAMSESDIKLWEDTVKNGLLNRDSTAIELIDIMRNVMTSNSGVDTSQMKEPYNVLSSLGISTYVWQERGLLHIDGDTEDAVGAMNDDKLRKAIEQDPEAVMNLLNGLGKALSDQLGKKMSSVANVKSAFTFYNDKLMDKEIEAKSEQITQMQERMMIIEARYRSQFTAMEKAMAASNATSSWLTQMLG